MELKGFWTGLKAAILASSCCSLPLAFAMLLATLGASSMTAALKIPKYKNVFILAGSLFLVASLYLNIKRRCGSCNLRTVGQQKTLIILSVVTYVTLTVLTIYLILPMMAQWIYS
jgi:hypothetical protein